MIIYSTVVCAHNPLLKMLITIVKLIRKCQTSRTVIEILTRKIDM